MEQNTTILYPIHLNDREELVNLSTAEACQGIFRIYTAITEKTAACIAGSINHRVLKHPGLPIYIIINSPGGHVTSGMAIFDTIEGAKAMGCNVYTIAAGMAASMGAFLLGAGTKGCRFATPSAKIVLHQPLGGVSGQATDMAIIVDNIVKTKEDLTKHLSDFTGQSVEELAPKLERDYHMSAEKALREGVIDAIDYEINIIQKG